MIRPLGNVRQADRNVPMRHQRRRSVGPFDDHDRPVGEYVIPTDRHQLTGMAKAIEVEMVDLRSSPIVLVDDCESGTRDVGGDSVPMANGSRERGLSGTEVPFDRNDEGRLNVPAQAFAPRNQFRLTERQPSARRQRRHN